ncbi:MAG: helix-turn-helix domain-containing protein [Candidatus Saliniplasma sp.]
MSEMHLNYKNKVLLFLKDYSDIDMRNQVPEDITQKGISNNVGMSRTHTSRILKRLRERDLLIEGLADVEGHERKLKGYRLTSRGFERAKELYEDIKNIEISVLDNGKEISMNVEHALDRYRGKLTLLDVIDSLEKNDIPLDLEENKEYLYMIEEAPSYDRLIDREAELKELQDWFNSEVPGAVLLGRRGYGCSTLAHAFIEDIDRHVLWIRAENKSLEDIKDRILSFLKTLEETDEVYSNLLVELCEKNVLVIFDDYYDVDDDVVDFLSNCIEMSDKGVNSKFLITSRTGIPVYERFYKIEDVENDKVKEIEIPAFDEEEAQDLLCTRLEKGAIERIMLMTKGSPLLLKLLKEGDIRELHKVSPLSKEQISLLMFLKTKVRE